MAIPNPSNDFHNAIRGDTPEERALLVFQSPGNSEWALENIEMFWTDADIAASSGLNFTETLNPSTELMIGGTPSATLQVSVFTEHGYLNDYLSGISRSDCTPFIGVNTGETIGDMGASARAPNCFAYIGETNTRIAGTSRPNGYLVVDNATVSTSIIDFPVFALIVQVESPGYLYIECIGKDAGQNKMLIWDLANEEVITELQPMSNGFMENYRFPQMAASRKSFYIDGFTIYEYSTLPENKYIRKTFEYYPLGLFKFDAPKTQDKFMITLNAFDKMSVFDMPMSNYADIQGDFWDNITFPITLGDLFGEVAFYYGYYPISTNIYNGTMQITQKPDLPPDITGRQLLGYIAEAACSVVRMNREGLLEMTWYTFDNWQAIYVPQQFGKTVGAYTVTPIQAVAISVPKQNGEYMNVMVRDQSAPNPPNTYNLSANPLLYADTEAQVRTKITPIFNRLNTMGTIRPTSVSYVGDWSIKAGDMVWIYDEDNENNNTWTQVFTTTITYRGLAVGTIECTGSPRRSDGYFGRRF